MGRFINRDTIGYGGGPNLYAAFGGNPVDEVDPDGADPLSDYLNSVFDNKTPADYFNVFKHLFNTPTVKIASQSAKDPVVQALGQTAIMATGLLDPAADFVAAEDLSETDAIVYRIIRADENPSEGLVAKDPTADYSPAGHVSSGSRPTVRSQYISTTRSLEVAERYASENGGRIVRIDLRAAKGARVLDLTNPSTANRLLNHPIPRT